MRMIGPISGDLAVKLLLGAAVGAALWWAVRKVQRDGLASIIPSVPDAINPASTNNVVYQAASAPFDGSLGARIWEWTHPGAVAAEKRALGDPGMSRVLDSLFVSPYWNADPSPFNVGA